MNFLELREKYPEFSYNWYKIEENENEYKIIYEFEIVGLSKFNPTWTIPKADCSLANKPNLKLLENMVFNLGMVELVSYWKITCAPHVTVKNIYLSQKQINWWKKLYFYGLGEFFYKNNIKTNIEEFMNITSGTTKLQKFSTNAINDTKEEFTGALVPIGGGKDSIVTLDVIKDDFKDNMCYVINPRGATEETAEIAGYGEDKRCYVRRTLDKNMLELNKQGYLNGHTPFSSIVAFSALIVAYLNKKKYIVLSNEASANESTIYEEEVNHQYSKSYEFEQDFNEYVKENILDGIEYFSLLRPISEYQIAKHFAKLPEFYKIFKSCNAGSKENKWCANCPKCLFVYIILSPFMSKKDMINIFGEDLLEKESLKETMEMLSGIQKNKPFECVGSRDEVNTAICETIKKYEADNKELPLLYKYYKTTKKYEEYINKENTYDKFYNPENNVPEHYKQMLKKSEII